MITQTDVVAVVGLTHAGLCPASQTNEQHTGSLEQLEVAQQRILLLHDAHLEDEHEQQQDGYSDKLFVIFGIHAGTDVLFLHLADFSFQQALRLIGLVNLDIDTSGCFRHLLAHFLVQLRGDDVAAAVLLVTAVAEGNRTTALGTDRENIDADALVVGSFGCFDGSFFMVFGIGDEDECLAHIVVVGKSCCCPLNSFCHVGALYGNGGRRELVEKHLGRHVVGGNRE